MPNITSTVTPEALVEVVQDGTAAYVPVKKLTSVLTREGFELALTFNHDKEVYFDATGQSIVFTLVTSPPGVNGVGILLKLNKPTAVTWPSNFIAHPSSTPLDSTKLNVYLLIYHSDWDGTGVPKVVYSNAPF